MLHGFEHDIDRVYELAKETRSVLLEPIADVTEGIVDHSITRTDPGALGEGKEIMPRDHIEEIALSLHPPGPSLNSAADEVNNIPAW